MAGAFSKKKASGAHWEGVVAQQLLPIPVVAAVGAVRLVREEEEEAVAAAAAAVVVAAAHPVRDSAVVVQVAAVGASW